ncbi:MAG: hypothetical protein P9L99_07855 [Candidatus Lernaella stagnicola]|nr:hypothetical protein [Candidatus Lernaella stagnicola]
MESMSLPHMIWYAAMATIALGIVFTTFKAFTLGRGSRAQDVVDTVAVECVSCGWKGEVPRLRRRCPICGDSNFTT